MRSATDFVLDLVGIPSVSSLTNQPVIDYVWPLLDQREWTKELHSYTDAQGKSKTNLIACTMTQSATLPVELGLVCHTDTVPYDPNWAEAVQPAVSDGKVFGRGACDVKGFLGCALAALNGLNISRLGKPLQVVLTADEEIGCVGAKRLAAAELVAPRLLVIGEPTGLHAVIAGKGYGLGQITVVGRESHSAFPAQGRSAIFDAARVVSALERVAAALSTDTDVRFDPPYTTLNVGLIHGGTAKNVVAGKCIVTVEWRAIPDQALPDGASRRVTSLIERELAELRADTGMNVQFEALRDDPGFAPSTTSQLADLLSGFSGRSSKTIAFGSEAPHLGKRSQEVVVFGPGDMTVAHRSGEYVPISELEECVKYLRALISQLCG